MIMNNTLTLIRKALKAKDGLLYLHEWGTGFQYLIFESEKEAANYLKALN